MLAFQCDWSCIIAESKGQAKRMYFQKYGKFPKNIHEDDLDEELTVYDEDTEDLAFSGTLREYANEEMINNNETIPFELYCLEVEEEDFSITFN